MAALEDVKKIGTTTKNLVMGFLRNYNHSSYEIPDLIYYWCLLYFFIFECFDEKNCGKGYTLSQNGTIITKTSESRRTNMSSAYLSKIAKSGRHEWKFRVNKFLTTGWHTTIGVWKSNRNKYLKSSINEAKCTGLVYGWSINAKILTPIDKSADTRSTDFYSRYVSPQDIEEKWYGPRKCKTGDFVTMILDLEKRTLSFILNGKDCGVAFKRITHCEYQAVVSINGEGDSLELISYGSSQITK